MLLPIPLLFSVLVSVLSLAFFIRAILLLYAAWSHAADDADGALLPVRFALHDCDTKFCISFRAMRQSGGIQLIERPRAVRT